MKPSGSTIAASIAKIVIGGQVTAMDPSGIVAQSIGNFSVAGFSVPIANGQFMPTANPKIQLI